MNINDIVKNKQVSIYKLSKISGIPYMTLNDICNGKTKLEKCNGETIYKLSISLGVTMEELLEPLLNKRQPFELFKSSVCQKLKEFGDIDFLINVLESNDIINYYQKGWYPECFYLLAMVDYISKINNVPLCDLYDEIRKGKLKNPIYPTGVIMNENITRDLNSRRQAIAEAIPEFLKYNIVESDIRNVY